MKVNLTLEERQREGRRGKEGRKREGEEKKTEINKNKKKQEEEGRRMKIRKSIVVCACQVTSVMSDSL